MGDVKLPELLESDSLDIVKFDFKDGTIFIAYSSDDSDIETEVVADLAAVEKLDNNALKKLVESAALFVPKSTLLTFLNEIIEQKKVELQAQPEKRAIILKALENKLLGRNKTKTDISAYTNEQVKLLIKFYPSISLLKALQSGLTPSNLDEASKNIESLIKELLKTRSIDEIQSSITIDNIKISDPELNAKLSKSSQVDFNKKVNLKNYGEVSFLAAAILNKESDAKINSYIQQGAKLDPGDFNESRYNTPNRKLSALISIAKSNPSLESTILGFVFEQKHIPNLLLHLAPDDINDPLQKSKYEKTIEDNASKWVNEYTIIENYGTVSFFIAAIVSKCTDDEIERFIKLGAKILVNDSPRILSNLYSQPKEFKILLEHFLKKNPLDNLLLHLDITNPSLKKILDDNPDLKQIIDTHIEEWVNENIESPVYGKISFLANALLENRSDEELKLFIANGAKAINEDIKIALENEAIVEFFINIEPSPNILAYINPNEIMLRNPILQSEFESWINKNKARWVNEKVQIETFGEVSCLSAAILNGLSHEAIINLIKIGANITDKDELRKVINHVIEKTRDPEMIKTILSLNGARQRLNIPEPGENRPTVGITAKTYWSQTHECAFLIRGFNVVYFDPSIEAHIPPEKFLNMIDCLVIAGSPSNVPSELITPGEKPHLTARADRIIIHNSKDKTKPNEFMYTDVDINKANPAIEMYLVQQAVMRTQPFCVTCYGHQIFCASQGAAILTKTPDNYKPVHNLPIAITEENIPNVKPGDETKVFLSHTQAADPKNLGPNLKITAKFETSQETVVLGVRLSDDNKSNAYMPQHVSTQYHPERNPGDNKSDAHFTAICAATETYQKLKNHPSQPLDTSQFLVRFRQGVADIAESRRVDAQNAKQEALKELISKPPTLRPPPPKK